VLRRRLLISKPRRSAADHSPASLSSFFGCFLHFSWFRVAAFARTIIRSLRNSSCCLARSRFSCPLDFFLLFLDLGLFQRGIAVCASSLFKSSGARAQFTRRLSTWRELLVVLALLGLLWLAAAFVTRSRPCSAPSRSKLVFCRSLRGRNSNPTLLPVFLL